jgi:hypothetical protein
MRCLAAWEPENPRLRPRSSPRFELQKATQLNTLALSRHDHFTVSHPFKANMEPAFGCCHRVDVDALPPFRRSLLSSFARRSDYAMDLAVRYRSANLYRQEPLDSHFAPMMETVRISKTLAIRPKYTRCHHQIQFPYYHYFLSPSISFRFMFMYWYIHFHMTVHSFVCAHSVWAFEWINIISDKIILRIWCYG